MNANLNGLGNTFAVCDLLCLVCVPRVLNLGVLASNPYSFNGVLCGSGILVVDGGLLFHGRRLWVLCEGLSGSHLVAHNPSGIKGEHFGL